MGTRLSPGSARNAWEKPQDGKPWVQPEAQCLKNPSYNRPLAGGEAAGSVAGLRKRDIDHQIGGNLLQGFAQCVFGA